LKKEEIEKLTKKTWITKFLSMNPKQLTAEIIRRQGGMWYQLPSGDTILSKDLGDYSIPGAKKIAWPDVPPDNFILDTDSFPDYGSNSSQAMQLGIEFRNAFGDPYRLNLETDADNHKRWLAIFRKCHAYAWGDTPAEALCRAYLLAYEISTD
jgi:hypothetical protein